MASSGIVCSDLNLSHHQGQHNQPLNWVCHQMLKRELTSEYLQDLCMKCWVAHPKTLHVGKFHFSENWIRQGKDATSVLSILRKCQTNFSFHTASAYPAMMGARWTRIVTEWLKLLAYLYDVCAVFSQGWWDCSNGVCPIPGKVTGQLNMV